LDCDPQYLGTAGDDEGKISSLIDAGLQCCDAIVLTGGVSVGDYDLTPAAMERSGVEILANGTDLKPGMACAYGLKGGKLVCGLSGNPASSILNFYVVAMAAVNKLCGKRCPIPQEITVTLTDGFKKGAKVTRLLRGTLDISDGTVKMTLPKDQGNVVISSSIGCDVIALIPPGSGPIQPGATLKGFMI
jgi:molybdopterin molybdotransferase